MLVRRNHDSIQLLKICKQPQQGAGCCFQHLVSHFLLVFLFRWLCRLRWAWRVTFWPSPTTCLCTITQNTGAELGGWTRQKERHPTWNTVFKARTKHLGSLPHLSLSPSLYFSLYDSTPLPPSLNPFPPVWLHTQPFLCLPLHSPPTSFLSYLSPVSSWILTFLSCRVSNSS